MWPGRPPLAKWARWDSARPTRAMEDRPCRAISEWSRATLEGSSGPLARPSFRRRVWRTNRKGFAGVGGRETTGIDNSHLPERGSLRFRLGWHCWARFFAVPIRRGDTELQFLRGDSDIANGDERAAMCVVGPDVNGLSPVQ